MEMNKGFCELDEKEMMEVDGGVVPVAVLGALAIAAAKAAVKVAAKEAGKQVYNSLK